MLRVFDLTLHWLFYFKDLFSLNSWKFTLTIFYFLFLSQKLLSRCLSLFYSPCLSTVLSYLFPSRKLSYNRLIHCLAIHYFRQSIHYSLTSTKFFTPTISTSLFFITSCPIFISSPMLFTYLLSLLQILIAILPNF